jgi:hypothetical protein
MACGASSDPQDAERTARLIAQRIVEVVGKDYVESFSAIDEIVRRMSTLPGQRSLILISPGFVVRDPKVSAAESQMINLAAQSNVTISTLSARGLYTTFQTAGNDNSSPYSRAARQLGRGRTVGPCRRHWRHVLPQQQRPGRWIQIAGRGAGDGLSARTFARQCEARRRLSPLESESKSGWLAGAGAPRLFHTPAGEGKH